MKYNASWKDIYMALSFRIVFGRRTNLWQEDGPTNLLFQLYKAAPGIASHTLFEYQMFQENVGRDVNLFCRYGSGADVAQH